MLEINKIHFGDCLDLHEGIDSQSIDMILTDLPYEVTQNHWDCEIDLTKLWAQYDRIIKPTTPILLFGQDKFTAKLMLFREDIHRYNWIWEKDRTSGFLNGGIMPLRCHEDICVFYNEQSIYNPQRWKGKPEHSVGRSTNVKKNNNYGEFTYKENLGNTDKLPRSVLYFPRPHPPIFPTEKPVNLIRYLIRTYTNAGALILDSCSGSGTLAVAAIEEKRNFIAIEKNRKNWEDSVKRYEPLLSVKTFNFPNQP